MFSIKIVDDKVNSHNYREYLLDLLSVVNNLPTSTQRGKQTSSNDVILNDTCGIGSKAFVIESSSWYILGNDDEWHQINGSGSSGGGGFSSSFTVSTDENHNLIFTFDDGSVVNAGAINILPDVTEADNGKTMKVVDGKWTMVNDEEETLTVDTSDTAGNYYSRKL